MATDAATAADIVHQSVSDYHAFDSIGNVEVESDGDGATFTVKRGGEWYDVTIRPSDICADCGEPANNHIAADETFVPRNAPMIPATVDNPA